jgi:glycogen debranching enzyme
MPPTPPDEPPLLPIRFGRAVTGELAEAERREWWLANGRGAYAAGTVAGTLTRRYHGLLVAPTAPPLGRSLVFAKADATLIDGAGRWPLYANRWSGGAVEQQGQLAIESFTLDGTIPAWRYALGALGVEMRIWMEHGANTTYAAWRLACDPSQAPRDLALSVRLLVNGRDHHGKTGGFDPRIERAEDALLTIADGDRFALRLRAVGGSIEPRRDWIENFDLRIERERGLGDRDSHLCAGEARFALVPGHWVGVAASIDGVPDDDLEAALIRRRGRDRGILDQACAAVPEIDGAPDWVQRLVLAADSFLFARPLPEVPDGQSVIAGYPWFGDWGRDTMIALPGLTLATGQPETARRILETFARFADRGMLPNVFPGAGDKPDYNTADATLWYIEAWRAYVRATGDRAALERVFPVLESICDWHRRGTRYGIALDPADGLLRAGEPGVQLTWMDAKVGDWVVTARIGKPVEINALWYNALCAMGELAATLGLDPQEYRAHAKAAHAGFKRFIRAEGQGLYDVIDGPAGDDATVRPNQIFAVSLPDSPLSPEAQRAVVAICGRLLLTSYGLRSLSPDHPEYRPQYHGDVWQRDGGYHQGPAWAWLLGPYALAEHRVHEDADAAQARLAPIADHLADAALGSVSEIFDGDAPHTPRGAPSQAWSVACVLEAWWRLEQGKRR